MSNIVVDPAEESEDVEVENYLPYYEQNEDKTTVAYEDIVYIEGTSPNSFTSFYQVDLDSGDIDMEVVLGDGGYNLYVYMVDNLLHISNKRLEELGI